jgi:EAL domain-containing protein (putative c-di-GMP-specific phosphodiesterase class I)/CheY-like chemotaxis protein
MQRQNSEHLSDGRLAMPVAYIADSEAHARICAMEALLERGFVCREFSDSSDLLDALRSQSPDLIVLDVSIRKSAADEALRLLESNRYRGSIIPITGRDTAAERLRELHRSSGLKVLPRVAKPFRLGDLAASLEHWDASSVGTDRVMDVEEAIRNNWVSLSYQPKVDPTSLAVSGAEALVRLQHPSLGLIPPSRFLPDLADPKMTLLSRFVIEQASYDWMRLAEEGRPLELAVNLPMRLLRDPQFLRFLRTRLPIHPRFSGMLVDVDAVDVSNRPDAMAAVVSQLRDLNIRFSVRDLRNCPPSVADSGSFPFAEVKLDREFTSGCASDKLKQALCGTLVDMAHRLGARAVAMGVETSADMAVVRELGFDLAQGFFCGRPMPPQELARFTATRLEGFRNLQLSNLPT